ncbi:Hpt domain-containing protein [Desulfovibrio sp. TomC]|uniref:Hpt domain-containing protein n=1 Tax=Desulfovibrio sp. TomC TaxID=1562888 RepID=UPI000573F3BC|nr:Hpt domain-containing protein [Desulfovibrio sp. TomC]KHK00397.1 hypothetical protein NY78_4146 [Desulfovibrio sp. TomC]
MPDSLPPTSVVVCVSRVLAPIYPQFLAIQREHLTALADALEIGDVATAGRLAHSAKGAAGTYELPAAAAIAGDLEAAVARGEVELASRLLGELTGYFSGLDVAFTDAPLLPGA